MKRETNRLRKTESNERANEDSYFAVKEHELVDDMRTEFRKPEAARRENTDGDLSQVFRTIRAVPVYGIRFRTL